MSRGDFPPATGQKFLVLMRQAVAKYGKPSRWSYQTKVEVRQWVCEQLKAGAEPKSESGRPPVGV